MYVWPPVLSFNDYHIHETKQQKNICIGEKVIFWLTLKPGLALTGFRTILARVAVHRMDNAIHRLSHYPVDSVFCFVNSYPLDSDLSAG